MIQRKPGMTTIERLALAAALTASAPALGEEVVRNWFRDPFFQARDAKPDCPVPLGPYITESQRLQETHYRSERGLRCFLEKKCSKPSSYMYDADIAAAVRARFAASPALRDASLWVTAQRRFIWVEGCVASRDGERKIEMLLKDVPDIDRLIVFVWSGRGGAAPYRTLQPGQRREEWPDAR
jgi:hypothetical protein